MLLNLEQLEPRCLLSVSQPDHVVVVVEENHSYSDIIRAAAAPYINSLAQQGALFTQSYAVEHPSQPNYLDLFSGDNQGEVATDVTPAQPFTTANLGAELIQAGRSFAGYSEDLPAVGSLAVTSGNYARKHNPWSDWQAAAGANALPASINQPFSAFPTDYSQLPTVSFVIPNLQDDMHDGTIQQGDSWLQANLSGYAQWAQTHNSLLIVTWDEDDYSENNQIPTIFDGPMVVPGSYNESITHYNVLSTIEDMYGLGHAGNATAQMAGSIQDVWQPVATYLSNNAVQEFRPNGTLVGTLSSAVANNGHTYTYTLVAGTDSTDNASFTISGNQLLTNDAFDFAAKSSYNVRIRATDETGQFVEQVLPISILKDPTLSRSGNTLTVYGTAGNDLFTFATGGVQDYLTRNGVNLTADTATVGVVVFLGGGGSDAA